MTSTPIDTASFVPEALSYSIEQTRQNLARLNSFPERAKNGQWTCADDGGWVGGHWVGLLWLAALHTADPQLNGAARAWAARLIPRQHDTTTHDLGFLFELSFILGATLTGDSALKTPALQAARTLALRFNPKGQFIQAWGPLNGTASQRGRAIIDTMMNLNLLFWASKESGDARFASIAQKHARTALKRHVRADWSTSHVTDFDPDTGEFLKQDTDQGMSATSCWSRGQAWAVYGAATCYRETKDAFYLDAARHLADYCLVHLPEDRVPYWDYDSPLIPNDVRDSSAAAILASGLLNLATLEPESKQAKRWRSAALAMLESLWGHYNSRGTQEPCILLHATTSKPAGYMDHGLIYGDYYFVEALTKLSKPDAQL
jgi:unsaturated chondroitin disaccharide hydrolase